MFTPCGGAPMNNKGKTKIETLKKKQKKALNKRIKLYENSRTPFFRDQRKSFVLSEGIYFPSIERT